MILFLPIVAYVLFILWVSYHWLKPQPELKTISHNTKVSVLIPFKDETAHLPQLIRCLSCQSYPKALVQLIFVDDHSLDQSASFIRGHTLVVNEGKGKKAALETGMKYASGELIVMLDADCSYGPNWLEILVNTYAQSQAALLIAPVRIAPTNGFWEQIQALEFQSLTASAAGAALGKHPIMCNGANLAFKKSFYNATDDVFKQAYSSGDDMFLMEYAKRKKAPIVYVKSEAAMASTKAVSFTHFWRQRFRWTSKAGGYKDLDVLISGGVVFLTNLSLLILPFVSLKMFLGALLLKLVVDGFLLSVSAPFFGHKRQLWLLFILMPIYPFYVLMASLGGQFYKRWK